MRHEAIGSRGWSDRIARGWRWRRRVGDGLRWFGNNRRGTTAVEFGLLVVPLLAIISAVFEIGYVDVQNEILANAVNDAARAMLVGNLQAAGVTTTQQFIANYLCQSTNRTLPLNFNCANLIIDVRPAATFAAGDTSNDFYKSTTKEFCPGQPGQVIVMRVAYPLPAIMPLNLFSRTAGVVSDVPNLQGRYHVLMGGALFQEENYAGTYTSPSGC